jgi:hypothetical protein
MAMDVERRKETRYPAQANVTVRTRDSGVIRAAAVDISSSGMRLQVRGDSSFEVDDEVTVEIELPPGDASSFSSWGLGRIAYIDNRGVGIQLFGGQFDPHSTPDAENSNF